MTVAFRSHAGMTYLLSFLFLFVLNLILVSRSTGQQVSSSEQEGCPGVPNQGQNVTTGQSYGSRPVPQVTINGEPWGGGYWEAGTRTYWHCHPGGQLLVIWEGEGRVQRRGESTGTERRPRQRLSIYRSILRRGAAPRVVARSGWKRSARTTTWETMSGSIRGTSFCGPESPSSSSVADSGNEKEP